MAATAIKQYKSAQEAVDELGIKGVINLLREDEHYYGVFGNLFVSASGVKKLLKNPKTFGVLSSDEKKEYLIGKYFHTSLLEPHKAHLVPFVPCSTRTTKVYKETCEANGWEVAMVQKDKDATDELITSMRNNFEFYEIINDPKRKKEEPTIGVIQGVWCKAKADLLGSDYVDDLKTDRDVEWFAYNTKKNGYHISAFIYQQLFGVPMRFLVIDKSTHMMGMYTISEETLWEGELAFHDAMKIRDKFFVSESEDINSYYYKGVI